MENMYLFSNDKISYDDYLKTVESMINVGSSICSKDCLETGIASITKMDDSVKRKKLIGASVTVDRELSIPYSGSANVFKKLPMIMTLANMIENHYPLIEGLNNDELVLLSYFSFVEDSSNMGEHLKLFGDHDLLSSVIEKTSNRDEQIGILGVVEDKNFEFAIDKASDDEFEKFKKESIMVVRNSSKEELLSMVKPIEEVFEELEEQGFSI